MNETNVIDMKASYNLLYEEQMHEEETYEREEFNLRKKGVIQQ